MSKRTKTILLILTLALVAFSAFHAWWTAPDPELKKDAAPPTPKPASVQSLQDETQRIIDDFFPGCNEISYDETGRKLVVRVWAYYFTARVLDEAMLERKALEEWHGIEQSLEEMGSALQAQYDAYGHPEISTIVEMMDPDDHDRVFATVSRGELVYDIVEATETGHLISEP